MASRDTGRATYSFPERRREGDRLALGVPAWAVIGIFLILALRMVADARAFLMPVSLGLLLFFVFAPLRRVLMRWGLGSGLTAAVITLGLLVGIGGLGFVVSGPVSTMMANSAGISDRLEEKAREIRSRIRPLQEAAIKLDEISHGIEGAAAGPGAAAPPPPGATVTTVDTAPGVTADAVVTTAPVATPGGAVVRRPSITVNVDSTDQGSIAATLVAMGPAIASQLGFTLLLLFFLLDAGDLLYLKIVQSFDTMGDKRGAYMALREIEDRLGSYLGAITLINACLGVLMTLAMWAWGMPSPVLFGIGMFVSNFVPYIGPFIMLVLAGVVGMFVYDDFWRPLLIAGTSMALTSVEGQLITPYFVSRKLQLNTVVVFLMVALWAWLWSVLGMIVAVPMLVVLRVLTEHTPGLQKFSNFLAGDAPPQLDDAEEHEARVVVEAGGEAHHAPQAQAAIAQVHADQPADGRTL